MKDKERLSEVLSEIGVNKETVLISINDEIYDSEEEIKNIKYLKEIVLLKVISGG